MDRSDSDSTSTGVTILGAVQAGAGRAGNRPQWSDDEPAAGAKSEGPGMTTDDDEGMDDAWMDAGDTTLGDLLGQLPLSDRMGVTDTPHVIDVAIDSMSDAHEPLEAEGFDIDAGPVDLTDGRDGSDVADVQRSALRATDTNTDTNTDADADDDAFPDSMYVGVSGVAPSASASSPASISSGPGSSGPGSSGPGSSGPGSSGPPVVSPPATSASAPTASAAPAPSKKRSAADGDDRWGAFAGGGPRWRDDADDWADVDAADTSMLGDESTRVGTLRAGRSERSDQIDVDDDDLTAIQSNARSDRRAELRAELEAELGKQSGTPPASSGVAKVLRFDSLTDDADRRSGGPQQRRGGRRRTDPPDTDEPDGDGGSVRPTRARPAASGGFADASSRAEEPARRESGVRRPTPQSTLGSRVGTGILLALAVALVFIFGKAPGAAVLVAVALSMGSIELMHALRERGFRPAIPPVALGIVATVAAGMFRGERGVLIAFGLTMIAVMCWYLFGVERERPAVNLAFSMMTFLYPAIGAATAALLLDAPNGIGLITMPIVCTVANDVFAYFGGRLLGRTPLTAISPNKTVEGFIIGVFGSIAAAVILVAYAKMPAPWDSMSGATTKAVLLGLVIGLVAPVGDLIESMLKRDLDVKDMGKLLPGHGGVLDRVDAMLLTVPATWMFAAAINLI
jgi:phosphatidate cytidylyltransferase